MIFFFFMFFYQWVIFLSLQSPLFFIYLLHMIFLELIICKHLCFTLYFTSYTVFSTMHHHSITPVCKIPIPPYQIYSSSNSCHNLHKMFYLPKIGIICSSVRDLGWLYVELSDQPISDLVQSLMFKLKYCSLLTYFFYPQANMLVKKLYTIIDSKLNNNIFKDKLTIWI